MFPTCVGMNRIRFANDFSIIDVPHMRGDEPSSLFATNFL